MPHLIIFSTLFLCALVVSCVLTSCQPLIQPFRPEERTVSEVPFLVRDAGGIVVRIIDGLPEGAEPALVESLINGLQKLDIPATTLDTGVNRRSLLLDGYATVSPIDATRMKVKIDWIVSLEGRVVARPQTTVEVRADAWGGAGVQPYALLGERSVEAIAAVVQDPTAVAASGPTPSERHLVVLPISGAPGNGGAELLRAMTTTLRAARLPVVKDVDDQALVIAGSVHVAPPEGGRQKVEIVWLVRDPSGREIAKLAQNNMVPAGQLDGDWSGIAPLITEAALPGLVDVLRQAPSRAEVPAAPRSGG